MKIQITEGEIMQTPNDFALGAYVRQKMWQEKELRKSNSDEHVILNINEDGQVISIGRDELEVCIDIHGIWLEVVINTKTKTRPRPATSNKHCLEL